MVGKEGEEILDCLARVEAERALREADAALKQRVLALKQFQQQRFRLGYADLLAHPRYAGAACFFLDELYGPTDFSRRDAQFKRIVRPLVRLFPAEVVGTVLQLARLHALSEALDTQMARHFDASTAAHYVQAWQACGQPEARARQIDLTLGVGQALDLYTRKPLLRHALRMMRGPASAAGLADLQRFLECGFDTFRGMQGASEFLGTVQQREQDWAARLFAGDPEAHLSQLMTT